MKRHLITTTSLAALLTAASASAFAGEAPAPDASGVGLDEIIVTANRIPQPLYQIGSSVTVLTRAAIEASQTVIVSDLLMQTPGVTFSRNGDAGGTTAVRIRGAETDQTTVIIDGVKFNDPSAPGGGYNFADLVTGDIERIEILRGAQSTLWGSQAIGGVVNIITAEARSPFEASAQAEGGSRNTAYGMLAAGGKSDRITWRLAGTTLTTDGVSAYALGTEKDGYQNSGATGRVRFDVTDDLSLDVRGVYTHAHNQSDGFPAPAFAFSDTAEFGKTSELVGYAGANFALLEGRFKSRAAYTYTDTDRDNFNPDQAITKATFQSVGKNRRYEYQGTFGITDLWNAVFGAEHESSSLRTASPSSFSPNPTPDTARIGITSGYAQVQGEAIEGLTLTGGLRYDDHDTFGGKALGQAAAAWALNDGHTIVRASFGQGFKAPTLYQLYSVYGNTGLSPEQANSWDGGIEQHLMDGAFVVSATGFYRRTRNQIDFVSCPSTNPLCTAGKFGVYDNIARTRAQGVELAASFKVDAFNATANYTLTDTQNDSPGNVNIGKDLARRPKNTANISASYTWPYDISTGIAVRYVGKAYDNAANSFTLHAYTLVDLKTSWQVNQTVEVYGRVENLFDEAYATTRNYGTAGRGAFAGVRAKF